MGHIIIQSYQQRNYAACLFLTEALVFLFWTFKINGNLFQFGSLDSLDMVFFIFLDMVLLFYFEAQVYDDETTYHCPVSVYSERTRKAIFLAKKKKNSGFNPKTT